MPWPPILAFFDFLAFCSFPIFLAFFGVFPFFPRILGVLRREKPCFFWGFPCCFFFFSKKQGLEGQKDKGSGVPKGGFSWGWEVSIIAPQLLRFPSLTKTPFENPWRVWNAENADTKTRKMRKMRLTGFNVTGFALRFFWGFWTAESYFDFLRLFLKSLRECTVK